MAIDKKKFLEMLSRPNSVSAAEVQGEDIDDDLKYSVENPEKPYSVPAQIKAGVKKAVSHEMDAPEVEHEIDDSGEMKLDELNDVYRPDEDIQPAAQKVVQSSEQNLADLEMKKKAIAATMKKYLGR